MIDVTHYFLATSCLPLSDTALPVWHPPARPPPLPKRAP